MLLHSAEEFGETKAACWRVVASGGLRDDRPLHFVGTAKGSIELEEMKMSQVQIFDQALCCTTGVCGPQVDPVLPRFAADVEWLKAQGHQVDRFNLAQEPAVFAANSQVQERLRRDGVDCLPLIFVDGQIVSAGEYPGREALGRWTNTQVTSGLTLPVVDGDCCGGSDCC